MKLTLEEIFKIEHELLSDNEYHDSDVVAGIIEFMCRILEKEEVKNNGEQVHYRD